jgi:CRP-like cAMP-binding protein
MSYGTHTRIEGDDKMNVWKIVPALRSYSKILLLYLKDKGADEQVVFLQQEVIMAETGLCRSSMFLAIAELTKSGILHVTRDTRPLGYSISLEDSK